jgi:hypothetical protein
MGGGRSGGSSLQMRASHDRCMRSKSARSACEIALAAKIPHAVALRRDLDDLDRSGGLCTALSLRCRRERNHLSAIDGPVRKLSHADDQEVYAHCSFKPSEFARLERFLIDRSRRADQ